MIEENGYIVTVRNRQLNIDVTVLHPRNLVQKTPGLLDVSACKGTSSASLYATDMNESVALLYYALALFDQNSTMLLI